MAARTLPLDPDQARRLLLGVQVGDAVACGIPLPVLRRELERLGCSPGLQRAIPAVKAVSALGLLAGRRHPRLGRLTTDALVAYFLCALGAHARVRDPLWKWAAAAGMLGLTVIARGAYADPEVIDLVPAPDEVDLTTPQGRAGAPTQEESVELPSRS